MEIQSKEEHASPKGWDIVLGISRAVHPPISLQGLPETDFGKLETVRRLKLVRRGDIPLMGRIHAFADVFDALPQILRVKVLRRDGIVEPCGKTELLPPDARPSQGLHRGFPLGSL